MYTETALLGELTNGKVLKQYSTYKQYIYIYKERKLIDKKEDDNNVHDVRLHLPLLQLFLVT